MDRGAEHAYGVRHIIASVKRDGQLGAKHVEAALELARQRTKTEVR